MSVIARGLIEGDSDHVRALLLGGVWHAVYPGSVRTTDWCFESGDPERFDWFQAALDPRGKLFGRWDAIEAFR